MNPRPIFVLPATLALMLAPAAAAVRYVNLASPSPAPPYTTWASAATNIQDAIDAANDGDEIVVTNGVYATGGRPVIGFALTNRVAVTKPVTVRSANGPEVTVIRGYQVPGTTGSDGAIRCVYLGNGAVLVGFTLTGGATRSSGDSDLEQTGGGLWCESASAVVSNCVLAGNAAAYGGGGAYSGTLNNCTLASNSAFYQGGGAWSGTLNNCTLAGNSASHYGGGACGGILNNCELTGNSASLGGGACYGALNNCTLSGNSANSGGGAAGCTLSNCIVYYNVLLGNGANYEANYYSGSFNYSCTTPLPSYGVGNISAEPQLTSASHLSAGSPCRGAGSAAYATGVDIDGEAWANPPSIGCDEYNLGAITGSLSVAIVANYTNVGTGFEVTFTAHIDGRTSLSQWSFGDGTEVTNRPYTAHGWAASGDYSVVLRAYNESHPEGVNATLIVHVVDQVHYVAANSHNPVAPYSSWATAAANIQNAVDAALVPGALVLVSDGVYQPVGMDKPLTLRSVNGPNVTLIDGGQAATCVHLASRATLAGFTLTNGAGGQGGGVWCESATAVVSNCVLVGNAAAYGGGAYSGTLNNCTLSGNSADYGGGAAGCTLNNCTLSGNSAISSGGGASGSTLNSCVINDNSARGLRTDTSARGLGGGAFICHLENCQLARNSARIGGGAFCGSIEGDGGILNNCLLVNNRATSDGGGAAGGPLINCTIAGNSAGQFGGGVSGGYLCYDSCWRSTTFLQNCIVYSNQAPQNANYSYSVFNYSCTTPLPPGQGNIEADPLFVNGFCDFRLLPGSPCIDAGTNLSDFITKDILGTPRPLDGDGDGMVAFDMGAYEFIPGGVGPLRITSETIAPDGQLHVGFAPKCSAAYYILYRGNSVTNIDTPVGLTLDADCVREMIDPAPVAARGMAFYRVREVPLNHPLDSDGDGIDDVYELRHPRFLNPLNPADAAQDFDHDGRSNLQEYLAGTNPARPPGQALAANDQSWFALKTNGSLWFFDSGQGQLQRFGGKSNYVAVFPGGFPVAAEDEWAVGSMSDLFGGAGGAHTLALKIDGGLWAWGDNTYGQLGDGTYNPYSNPIRIGTSIDWKTVAAGTGFSTAIKTDGSLWTWGDNGGGQLGNGSHIGTNISVQIGIDHDWAAIENSKFDYFNGYTLALKTNGSLWMWGCTCTVPPDDPRYTFITVPTRIGADSDWSTVAAGNEHIVALKSNGSLWTWDNSTGGNVPTRLGTETNWVSITAGVNVSVALKRDGTVWSWTVGEFPHQVGTDTDWGLPP